MFSIIIATTEPIDSLTNEKNSLFGIGYNNGLPWNCELDLLDFKKVTTENDEDLENIVIMGKNTWLSLKKPLSKRINIVVSSTLKDSSVLTFKTLDEALEYTNILKKRRNIFVIGGAQLYKEAFFHPCLERVFHNVIINKNKEKYSYDTFLEVPYKVNKLQKYETLEDENFIVNKYVILYENTNDGKNYHELLDYILTHGKEKPDRTGVGTISIFTPDNLTFDLTNDKFPLITTKFTGLKTVFEELMFFIRGQTNNNILKQKKVFIWNGNSSLEYMSKLGLNYPDGEMGPIYSAQWRNFGGKHDININNHIATTENKGFDQLNWVINEIKNNPHSRRLLVSAWNPKDIPLSALPPCHYSFQFYVEDNLLSCKLCMRSTDTFLGLPFNIASYSLLTIMVANMTNLKPGKLFISFGDAHIYKNHIEKVKKLLLRPLRNFPTISIKKVPDKIEDWEFDCFEIKNYNPHPKIKGEMAI
jgi:thymidylate synthase